ncbi:uncharacterized protein LOC110253133 [Exaiptasia diaphana]|uniref:Uncharacterized protein n=1 Tax=Exaiptasia diaphana TaxID=2652724 RepID=A0A913Y842_EXADI|nr:uncharacterized protein LOC110253133 [Exaiptasia diaphana]
MSLHFLKQKETNDNSSKQRPACVLYSPWLVPVSTQTQCTQDYRSNLEYVSYRSEKELRMLNESLHSLQMSEIDLYLQTHFSTKALDAMQGLDVTHRSFPLIYRSLWGLVCCDGKSFPSVVRHTAAD